MIKDKIKKQIVLLSILGLGLALRLISLNQSFWLDEATSGYIARDLSVGQILEFVKQDVHPPFYYIALKGWGSIFGFSEIALRILSIASAIGTIWMTYFLAGEVFGKNRISRLSSIFSTLLLATSGLFIYYSQEARMYALETFFAASSTLFFLRTKKDNFTNWVLYSLSITALCATDYLPWLVIAGLVVVALVEKRGFSWWKKFIACHLPLLILFIVWLPYLQFQLNYGLGAKNVSPIWWEVLGTANLKNLLLVPVKFVIGRITLLNKTGYLVLILCAVVPYIYLFCRSVLKRRSRFLVLLFFVPLTLAFLISFKVSAFSYHRLLFLLPTFYLLTSYGLFMLKKPFIYIFFIWVLVVNLATTFLYLRTERFHRENWRDAIGYISRQFSLGQPSVVISPSITGIEAFKYYDPQNIIKVITISEFEPKYDIIWLMRYAQPIFDPQDVARNKMEGVGYKKIGEFDFNGVIIWKYIKRPKS